MKKTLVSLFVLLAVTVQANAATWVAKDRVSAVGQQLLTKNGISAKLTFKVVEGAADNSESAKTKIEIRTNGRPEKLYRQKRRICLQNKAWHEIC